MAIIDLFSKRQRKLKGEVVDVYFYDKIPKELKIQIVHIIRDSIGEPVIKYNNPFNAYKLIHETLCREYGVFTLSEGHYNESDEEAVLNFFLRSIDTEKALDIIELFFRYMETIIDKTHNYKHYFMLKTTTQDAINELNYRFKEHGFGYQYEGELIRVDATFVHSEITKPTIHLLNNKKFIGANEEYLKAHEHYRHGRNKECLTECLKAFESTIKIICIEKGWMFNQTDTSKKLIQVCFQNNLVPAYTQNQFTSLQNLMESGIPTIRNKLGGHGQGQIPQIVDDATTRYGLNLTGTNIIFLIAQSKI